MLAVESGLYAPTVQRYTAPHDRPEAAAPVVTILAGEGERTLPDEVLAARIAQRDVAALELLYERHGRALFSLAVKMLDDHHAAEEVVQETFLKLWQRPETYVPERGRLLAWLLGVTHHRAVDRLDRKSVG